jgi:hypothetical protein
VLILVPGKVVSTFFISPIELIRNTDYNLAQISLHIVTSFESRLADCASLYFLRLVERLSTFHKLVRELLLGPSVLGHSPSTVALNLDVVLSSHDSEKPFLAPVSPP